MTAEERRPLPGAAGVNGAADVLTIPLAADNMGRAAPGTCRISTDHARLLEASAIAVCVAAEAGVYSVSQVADLPQEFRHYGTKAVPALVFSYEGLGVPAVPQLRPDNAWPGSNGSTAKYLFPSGAVTPVTVHPRMRARVLDVQKPLVFVEGTKQYLAAVTALEGEHVAAVGMSGCWGWSHDKKLTPGLLDIPLEGRIVYLLLDADRTTNSHVFDAAAALAAQLTTIRGVAEVRYASLPTQGTSGLDDVLALAPAAERGAVIRRILAEATEDPGERPQGKGGKYFGRGGLRVRTLADDILAAVPLAVGVDGYLYLYRGGVYMMGRDLILGEITSRLDERYRPAHATAVVDFLTAELRDEGRLLPDAPSGCLLNVRNGMLDLTTLELLDHDPAYLSAVQLPVEWDPAATAPVYERWLRDQAGDQADDLEETACTMLDSGRAPSKAVFLFGPTRSGKSTFLRLMAGIAGRCNTSAVTLQHLSSNRFASARLHGKLLNCAADLSSHHVDDLATFKLLTGGDPVHAENKFAHPFEFTNHALIAFSANEIPSVGENSNAYLERIKPFSFGASFAGREDPSIEQQMLQELPGILVRWVHALRRLRQRGKPLPTAPQVAAAFANKSDRVRMFLSEMTVPDERGVTRKDLYIAFRTWANDSAGPALGKHKFFERVRLADVAEYKHRTRGMSFRVKVIDPDQHRPAPPDVASDVTASDPARDGCDSSSTPSHAATPSESRSTAEEKEGCPGTVTTVTEPQVVFDLETADADLLFTYRPHDRQGYVRLSAWNGHVASDPQRLLAALERAEEIVGHNILSFDLQALARHHGADYRRLAAKSRDTLVLARLADPPPSRQTGHAQRAYGLDALGQGRLGKAKTADLKPLKLRHGGYDRIPLDDPDYQRYALHDVELAADLADLYPMTDYGAREHRVLAVAGEMTLRGFRVDVTALDRSSREQSRRRQELVAALPVRDGLATHTGKRQLANVFADLGVDLPCNDQGLPKIGRDQMDGVIASRDSSHPAVALARQVRELNGQRSLLDQVRAQVVDERVHARVDAGQATGRWSITKPALTTLGKRAGLHRERSVFQPEPGEVILVADLSQIDARAVAAHCQDDDFLDLFLPGRDFHLEVATQVLADASQRDTAKMLNHSVNYGVGAATLSRTTGLPPSVCQDYLDGMAARYPRWAQWRRDVAEQARVGVLLDNGFGRKLRVDADRARTAGPAAIGQSCARDLLMEGLLRLDAAGLTPMLRCVVHDEVVLSVPRQDYDEVGRLVLDCLSFDWAAPGTNRAVAVTAELGKRPGSTWAEVYA